MSASAVAVSQKCRACGASLSLDEMHYYADEDGTATCNDCESKWLSEMTDYRAGLRDTMPDRP